MLAAAGMSLLSGTADSTAAAHQRSASESVRWSLALLDPVRQGFLAHLAALGPVFGPEDVELSCLGTDYFAYGVLGLLGDLVEASLVRVHRAERYSYSLFADVFHVLGAPHAAGPRPESSLSRQSAPQGRFASVRE